jgi:hypothetical protein
MTLEECLRIELADVRGVEVECGGCQTTVTFKPVNFKPGEIYCPGCSQPLWQSGTGDYRNIREFASAFRALIAQASEDGKTRVRLQLPWPNQPEK